MQIALPLPFADALRREFLGNTLQGWITATITVTVLFLIFLFLRWVLVSRLGVLAARTTNQFDDMLVEMLKETRTWALFLFALFTGGNALYLGRAGPYVSSMDKLVVLLQMALWAATGVDFWMKGHLMRRTDSHDRASIAMIGAMAIGAKVILWILVLTTALYSVFGINPTSLITTLGVSGIAVALAVQNILGDLLAALAIVFDKPFDVGDTIGVDAITGTVEHIGLKTTRLRSITGEQIIIGNGDVLKSRLRNYRRMRERRVLFVLDVTYDTPTEVLAELPRVIEAIVKAQTPVRFDRSHVASFGESAIKIETVYYVLDPDYKKYMGVQEAVNLDVLRQFTAKNVAFAFPSRTVYHEGLVAKDVVVGKQPEASTG